MVNPFTTRKPWVAFLVALLLHPFIGMLYISRARLAGLYFLFEIGVFAAFVMIYPNVLGSMDFKDAMGIFALPLAIIGAVHAAYLAWKYKRPVAWYGRWYIVLGIPVAYVACVFAITRLLFTPYYLPSQSMLPNFAKNDCFIASRRAYDGSGPVRGDVIAFRNARDVVFIKRIIGVPHDRVAVRDGIVFLNGTPLPHTALTGVDSIERLPSTRRSYIVRKLYPPGSAQLDNSPEVTIPAGSYYVLGDNRDNSMDSRSDEIGLVARKDIVGPVVLKLFDGSQNRFIWKSLH